MLGNSKFQHLIEAVVYIALHAKPDAVRGPEICAAQGLPERYLEADLQRLVHDGVLRSVRGPKGGYVLAKERRNITLADIYTSIKKDKLENESHFTKTVLAPFMVDLNVKLTKQLAEINIESLAGYAQTLNSSELKPAKPEFVI